ncbi:MAG: hypothetical protein JWM91_2177, partial [Rhodospirillales bacterium]|nr:hypothetical protein [Rhodospirillales bacterium]
LALKEVKHWVPLHCSFDSRRHPEKSRRSRSFSNEVGNRRRRASGSDFDELWLFAVDTGNGLSRDDCAGIARFRKRGGGILTARDHEDLGSSLCTISDVGAAHFFHPHNSGLDESHRVRDDIATKSISWPNYHSGRNGDYQRIKPIGPLHELLRNPASASGAIEYFPAHPHEGSVGVPPGERHARVIATGASRKYGPLVQARRRL